MDVISCVPVDRAAWEGHGPYPAAVLEEKIADRLARAADAIARTRGRHVRELVEIIDAKPADESEELETFGEDVRRDPAAYVVIRGRFSTVLADRAERSGSDG